MSSKFWVSKVVMHTGLNVYKENSGDSRFITNSLLVSYKWSQTRFTSCTNFIFFVTFIKLCPIHIQKNISCGWIEIKESPKYPNTNFNTGDLPETTFSFHSNDFKRNPWVTLCLHCPINDSCSNLYMTIYFAVMLQASWHTAEGETKSQKVQISSHDALQKLHNFDFAWHRSQDFLREEVEKQELSPSPINFFENNKKLFPWNLRVYVPC